MEQQKKINEQEKKIIAQNLLEDENFSIEVDKCLNPQIQYRKLIHVGKTPNVLVICGIKNNLNIKMKKSKLIDAMKPEILLENGRRSHKSGHNLDVETVKKIPKLMRNPLMVLKGSKDNSLVLITDLKDCKNREILMAINLFQCEDLNKIHKIDSIYGRDNFNEYLRENINKGNILAYDKKRTDELLRPIGVDFPAGKKVISYDESIAYTFENVNIGFQ